MPSMRGRLTLCGERLLGLATSPWDSSGARLVSKNSHHSRRMRTTCHRMCRGCRSANNRKDAAHQKRRMPSWGYGRMRVVCSSTNRAVLVHLHQRRWLCGPWQGCVQCSSQKVKQGKTRRLAGPRELAGPDRSTRSPVKQRSACVY